MLEKLIKEELDKLYDNDNFHGIVRLYHAVYMKQVSNMPALIKSVIQNGLVPHDNGEIGSLIWLTSKYDSYGDKGNFVLALDFDKSTNGYMYNKYQLAFDGTNGYARAVIPFKDLVVIKIPVIDMYDGMFVDSKKMIDYMKKHGWYSPDKLNNDEKGKWTVYADIINKYVQPYIDIPDYINKLNPDVVNIINVL